MRNLKRVVSILIVSVNIHANAALECNPALQKLKAATENGSNISAVSTVFVAAILAPLPLFRGLDPGAEKFKTILDERIARRSLVIKAQLDAGKISPEQINTINKRYIAMPDAKNRIMPLEGDSADFAKQWAFKYHRSGLLERSRLRKDLRELMKIAPYIAPVLALGFFAIDASDSGVQAATASAIHETLGMDSVADGTLGPRMISEPVEFRRLLAMDEAEACGYIHDSPVLRQGLPKLSDQFDKFIQFCDANAMICGRE